MQLVEHVGCSTVAPCGGSDRRQPTSMVIATALASGLHHPSNRIVLLWCLSLTVACGWTAGSTGTRQQDDEQTCWWGLGCRLLLAGRRSAERRRRRRPRARLARRVSDDAAGRCCAMAAQRSGSGRQARVWTSLCAQRLQGSAWVSGPAADRVGPAADATGGVHVRPCVFLGVMYNPKGATSLTAYSVNSKIASQ